MTGRFWLITILTLIVVLLVGNQIIIPYLKLSPISPTSNDSQSSITINNISINVEIADDPQEIQQGLSGRPSMSQDQGMLFVLPQRSLPSFWMKDMQFPLDFVWIDQDVVIDITKNVPPPKAGQPLQLYTPTAPATHVLEVNAGWVEQNQISIDDKVLL